MEEKDEVLEYMINKMWLNESKLERKYYLFEIAKESKNSEELSTRIGGVLIFNQITEQLLKEVIMCSIAYVKAEIWPTDIELKIEIQKATFGKLIDYFKQFTIKKYNREVLIESLMRLNKNRNEIVHKLFDIENSEILKNYLSEYVDDAEETIKLLMEYYNAISEELTDLDNRVDFSCFE